MHPKIWQACGLAHCSPVIFRLDAHAFDRTRKNVWVVGARQRLGATTAGGERATRRGSLPLVCRNRIDPERGLAIPCWHQVNVRPLQL